MAKKQKYYEIKYYEERLQKHKDNKEDFITANTTYTKKIILPNRDEFFNEEGKEDKKGLLLLNEVRNDAKRYMAKHPVLDVYKKDTDFFNLLDVIDNKKVIKKIDLKSAYWIYALKETIITEKTNQKFLEWYADTHPDYAKQARLRALGSLATTKLSTVYEKGKFKCNLEPERQPTKKIYMSVCNGVDTLMKDLNYNVPGCYYYYWDCMFVDEEHEQEAIEYIKMRGYDISSIKETRLEHINIGRNNYVISLSDSISYMTKRENKNLLNFESNEDFYV